MGLNKRLFLEMQEEEYYKEQAYIKAQKEQEYEILKKELTFPSFLLSVPKKSIKIANFVVNKSEVYVERNRNRNTTNLRKGQSKFKPLMGARKIL